MQLVQKYSLRNKCFRGGKGRVHLWRLVIHGKGVGKQTQFNWTCRQQEPASVLNWWTARLHLCCVHLVQAVMSSHWTWGRSLLTPGAPQSPVQSMRSLPWQSSCSVVIRAEDTDGTSALRGAPTGRSRNRDKHPPPPHPSMETAVPSEEGALGIKPSQAVKGQVSTPGGDERKHGPSVTTPAVPLSHNVRKRMNEKGEQSGDEVGRTGRRPAMIRRRI